MTHQIDENGAHSGSERQAHGKDKPEHGKVYALTGKSDQPSIARGDSWKKSVVTKKRKEQDAKKEDIDPRLVIAKKKRAADLAKRQAVAARIAQSRQGKEQETAAVAGRKGIRKQQATKHSQKRWKEELDTWHPDPEKDKKSTSYKHHVKQMKSEPKRAAVTPQQILAILAKQKERQQKEEHDCNESHPGMTHKEWVEDQKIEATYTEDSSKVKAKKSRKYRQVTPGQVRDYEKLSAARMFKAYEEKTDEDAPATSTGGVAKYPTILFKQRRKIDGRTKDYRETVTRLQARRDAVAARDLEQKLNMFGVQSNPFKEETEMENNKKYLKTKDGSIEEAVLKSLMTDTPVNPNDARPTLHLPKNYLANKEGSLEEVVTRVMTDDHVPGHGYKLPRQLKDPKREKMVGTKKGTKVVDRKDPRYKKHPEHESLELEDYSLAPKGKGRKAAKALYKEKDDRGVGTQAYADYVKNLTPGEGDSAVVDQDAQKASKASHDASKEKKLRATRIDDEYQSEAKETEGEYGHATALYKDQWKDRKIADYDKEHDKEKRAKEMRADAEVDRKRMWAISKDKWKHGKYSTGEEEGKRTIVGNTPTPKDAYKEEVSPLVQATIDELSKKTLGSYVKKASDSKVDAGMALQRTADKNQTRGDVDKHVGKMMKRGKGISKAVGKLVKDEVELDEKDWIKGAIKKPGALRRQLDVPAGENIPAGKLKDASKAGGKLGQRARLAITLKKMHDEFEPDMDEVHSPKDQTTHDDAIAAFKKKGGKVTQVKSKGLPKWAKAAHQKSGPPSAHKMYKPGSGKSEEVE